MSNTPDDKPIALDAFAALAERYARLIGIKPHNAYYEQPATRALVPRLNGQRVLDAGCGTAIYSLWMLEQGAEVVGVDVSPEMLEYGRQRAGGRAELHLADLRAPLDFLADESFDGVLSSLVLHYLEDWQVPLAEFHRVLRPGGWLVFSTGHPAAEYRDAESSYFEVEQAGMLWRGWGSEPVYVPYFRRPLSAITEALWRAGFVIERLIEPLPTEEFRQANPQDYEMLLKKPAFMCVRARKVEPPPADEPERGA